MPTNPNTPATPPSSDGPSSESLLTEAQAAAILNIAPATLKWWRCMRNFAMPVYCRIGGAIRYRRADIEAFIAASAQDEKR